MSFKAFLSAICAAALALGAVATTEYFERSRFKQEQRADAVRTASVLRAKLEAALNERLHLTYGVGAFGGAEDGVTVDRFRAFAEALVPNGVKGVRSLQLAPNAVVQYVYPLKGNEAVIGHNLLADPARKASVERAIQEKLFVVAGPVRLIQGGTGLIARQPLFRKDRDGNERFWGFATAVLDVEPILDAAGLLSPVEGYQVALRGRDGKGAAGEAFFGEEAVFAADPILLDVTLPHGSWQIALVPNGGWTVFGTASLWILVFGIGMAATIGVAVFTSVREPERLREEVQRATAALSESEARYRAVSENANDPILTIDQQGHVVSANAAALAMFKLTADEMRGTAFAELVPAGRPESDAAIVPVTCRRKGGDPIEAEASFSDWCSGGECFTTVILRDISERRRMEARQAMLRDQFHQAQKMEAVGTLAAGSAHQFNNILNTMLANTEAAAAALEPDHPAAPLLHAVQEGGWRAADIVRRLLAFSQNNGGDHHPVDVIELVRRTVEQWQAESAAPVKVELDSQQPQVFAEETQLEQALVALLENASDALPEGSKPIRVKVGVEVIEEDRLSDAGRHMSSSLPRGIYAAIAVEDEGSGIPDSELPRIFEPFYTTKPVDQGAGLGLFVVSGTARGFGGSVAVESKIGHGSRFTLLLPCVQH